MRNLVILLMLVLLVGCATQENYRNALKKSIGMTEETLISRIGVPNRIYELNNKKYLVYSESQSSFIPGYDNRSYDVNTYGYTTTVTQTGYARPSYYANYNCETTFIIEDNIVQGFTFKGNACKM